MTDWRGLIDRSNYSFKECGEGVGWLRVTSSHSISKPRFVTVHRDYRGVAIMVDEKDYVWLSDEELLAFGMACVEVALNRRSDNSG